VRGFAGATVTGVHGSAGTGGTGVFGAAYGTYPVGENSASAVGVVGVSDITGVQGSGDVGVSGNGVNTGVYGFVGGSGSGVAGICGTGGIGVLGDTQGVGKWAVFDFGNIGATGAVAQYATEGSISRTLYCMGSPECWFEDFGSGTLVGGSAQVQIDPVFASTVHTDQYYVFLVPEGDCKGVVLSHKWDNNLGLVGLANECWRCASRLGPSAQPPRSPWWCGGERAGSPGGMPSPVIRHTQAARAHG
jgi:hypothetical protein